MAADIQAITDRYPVDTMTDTAKLEEILTLLRSLDGTLAMLLAAAASGGAKGFRSALGRVSDGR